MKFIEVFLLLTVLLSMGTSFSLSAQVSSKEKKALIQINQELKGDNWGRKWNLSEPVSSWHGVKVVDGRVEALNLIKNNLKGEIPERIGIGQ